MLQAMLRGGLDRLQARIGGIRQAIIDPQTLSPRLKDAELFSNQKRPATLCYTLRPLRLNSAVITCST
jgi:hypothetical protein